MKLNLSKCMFGITPKNVGIYGTLPKYRGKHKKTLGTIGNEATSEGEEVTKPKKMARIFEQVHLMSY